MLAIYLMAFKTHADKSKFENLYTQYERLLFSVAFGILCDYHLAEDAVNDAFIKIIENIDRIDEIDRPRTKRFVVIVIKNVCFDMLRKKKRHSERLIDIDEPQWESDDIGIAQGVQEEFFQRFEMQRMKCAFQALRPDYQIVLYYHAVLGESINRVAEMLGTKPETAKKRIYRARQSLRKILEEDNAQ